MSPPRTATLVIITSSAEFWGLYAESLALAHIRNCHFCPLKNVNRETIISYAVQEHKMQLLLPAFTPAVTLQTTLGCVCITAFYCRGFLLLQIVIEECSFLIDLPEVLITTNTWYQRRLHKADSIFLLSNLLLDRPKLSGGREMCRIVKSIQCLITLLSRVCKELLKKTDWFMLMNIDNALNLGYFKSLTA